MKLYTSEERKNMPVYSGVLKYFPLALLEIAKLSKAGNDKHNAGQPLHWAREKSSDHLDALARHLINYSENKIDEEDNISHMAKICWRAMAQLQLDLENDKVENKIGGCGVCIRWNKKLVTCINPICTNFS